MEGNNQFDWVPFYRELANKLLAYKNNRQELVTKVYQIFDTTKINMPMLEKDNNLEDMDPFTFFGLFNKTSTRKDNRLKIIQTIAEIFSITAAKPTSFDGIPVLNQQNATYYLFVPDRGERDMGDLWELFDAALAYANNDSEDEKAVVSKWFDVVIKKKGIGNGKLTMGLYWIAPDTFLNLDHTNESYIYKSGVIPSEIVQSLPKMNGKISASKYFEILEKVQNYLRSDSSKIKTFEELSFAAWEWSGPGKESTTRYWLFAPGSNASEWDEFYKDGIMAINWYEIGDLKAFTSQEAMRLEMQKCINPNRSFKTDSHTTWQFANDMHVGDVVFVKKGNSLIVGRGVVASDYEFLSDKDGYNNVRKVNWTHKGEWQYPGDPIQKTLTDITKKTDIIDELEEMIGLEPPEDTRNYWWLVANPNIWNYTSMPVGEVVSYTLYNENGNKRRIFQNFLDAKVGDKVIGYEATPVKQIVAVCEVTAAQDGERIQFKKLENLTAPIDLKKVKEIPELEGMEFFANAPGSLFKLTKDEFDCIMDLIREENPLTPITEYGKYGKTKFLDEVFMSEDDYDDLVAMLSTKKNLILQGAPGVGKTYAAKRLAYSVMEEMDDDRIKLVQFHQNYSYEDFIMGIKPTEDGSFRLQPGIFYQFCQKAANQPGKKFFFIIDEINRGNMSKIFGELLMLIENDHREEKTTLAYSGQLFSVPENLYIIGMMNTADRSLAMIDYALRRRFSFFTMEPGFDQKQFKKYQAVLNNKMFDQLINKVKELNKKIADDKSLGKGFCIGHSYFSNWDKKECTEEKMKRVVKYEIVPMLEEYWFDNESESQEAAAELMECFNGKTQE